MLKLQAQSFWINIFAMKLGIHNLVELTWY
jgi:hypothetical protein